MTTDTFTAALAVAWLLINLLLLLAIAHVEGSYVSAGPLPSPPQKP